MHSWIPLLIFMSVSTCICLYCHSTHTCKHYRSHLQVQYCIKSVLSLDFRIAYLMKLSWLYLLLEYILLIQILMSPLRLVKPRVMCVNCDTPNALCYLPVCVMAADDVTWQCQVTSSAITHTSSYHNACHQNWGNHKKGDSMVLF